jgi:hypothetical protein
LRRVRNIAICEPIEASQDWIEDSTRALRGSVELHLEQSLRSFRRSNPPEKLSSRGDPRLSGTSESRRGRQVSNTLEEFAENIRARKIRHSRQCGRLEKLFES